MLRTKKPVFGSPGLHHVFTKLGVRSRVELVDFVFARVGPSHGCLLDWGGDPGASEVAEAFGPSIS
jgi:hypothetical protein